jgi:hypothetical protein
MPGSARHLPARSWCAPPVVGERPSTKPDDPAVPLDRAHTILTAKVQAVAGDQMKVRRLPPVQWEDIDKTSWHQVHVRESHRSVPAGRRTSRSCPQPVLVAEGEYTCRFPLARRVGAFGTYRSAPARLARATDTNPRETLSGQFE